jgi:2-polyprenyl-6-methoxyphenol hydroxylase-like FAD-dependent oxidoreductase
MGFKIAIVGAGPAGCMLARLLTHRANDINVIVFEAEESLDLRSQGGTLDLHVKTGQRALKEAGLYDAFLEYARFDGEAMSLADKNLLCYVKVNGNAAKSSTGRPEIDRPRLRQILFESLPEHTIKWGHKLTQVEREESTSEFTLHFAGQPPQTGFDLVVGADGAWSKVRPVLSPIKPFYSGIAGHAFRITDAKTASTLQYDLVNRGSLFAWSNGKSIMAQYMGDGSLNIGTWALKPEGWRRQCGYDVHDAKAVKEACIQEYADWDPRLVSFTQCAEDHVVPRDLYMLPVGHRWKHIRGVTLIGDAAHLMGEYDCILYGGKPMLTDLQ